MIQQETQKAKWLSPLGPLVLRAGVFGLTGLEFGGVEDDECEWPDGAEGAARAHIETAVRELEGYFAGWLREFTVPLDLRGTTFQLSVWRALSAIPYGETRSYKEIAAAIGRPTAVRAVGGANHRNPVAIIVPCHRVIAADGSLAGYGGGIWRKERLLALESVGARCER